MFIQYQADKARQRDWYIKMPLKLFHACFDENEHVYKQNGTNCIG